MTPDRATQKPKPRREADMCGAVSSSGRKCNRHFRHSGEHRDVGPDTLASAGVVYERWPRKELDRGECPE